MKILTSVVNNPIFIEIQFHTFKKYMKCEYEFIVFNDAKEYSDCTNGGDITIKKQIEDICKKLDIQCINVPNFHHVNMGMSQRHGDTFTNHVLKYQLNNPDKYLLLDSDMFLIDYFDHEEYFKYECRIVLQNRGTINYISNQVCYLDFTKLTNTHLLDWNCVPGLDAGGMTKIWLNMQCDNFPSCHDIRWKNEVYQTEKIYFIKHLWSTTWNKSELPQNLQNDKLVEFLETDPRNTPNYFCEIYDNKFLHYRAGSNWNGEGMNLHKQLSEKLKNILLD